MSNRCPSCAKFVSLDTEVEPEEQSEPSADNDGTISFDVRITNNCADCSEELTEATMQWDVDLTSEVEEHRKDTPDEVHDLEVEEPEYSRVERSEGKGRGRQTFYGVEVTFTLKCSCGWEHKSEGNKEEVQASSMESLV